MGVPKPCIGAGLTQELCQFIHYELVYANYDVVSLGNGITIPMKQYLDQILTVGASGSVYGILLGYGMTFPENRLIIFMPIPIPIKAKWLVVAYVVLELLLGLRNSAADNVAHFAHLGGMLAGFLIMLVVYPQLGQQGCGNICLIGKSVYYLWFLNSTAQPQYRNMVYVGIKSESLLRITESMIRSNNQKQIIPDRSAAQTVHKRAKTTV